MQGRRDMKRMAWIAILLGAFIMIGLCVLDKVGTRRAIAGIRAPIQTETDPEMFQINVAGFKTVITYKYAYDIEALVAHTKDYFSFDVGDQLSPRDLTLIWGKVAEHNQDVDFHWTQMTRRTIMAIDSSVDQEKLFGGEAGVANPWSTVGSAEEAASGAGIEGFMVPEGAEISLGEVAVNQFRCMEGLAAVRKPLSVFRLSLTIKSPRRFMNTVKRRGHFLVSVSDGIFRFYSRLCV